MNTKYPSTCIEYTHPSKFTEAAKAVKGMELAVLAQSVDFFMAFFQNVKPMTLAVLAVLAQNVKSLLVHLLGMTFDF